MLLAEALPGWDGVLRVLGFRGSVMLDFVALAMFAVLPVLAWSYAAVKYQRNYVLHKRLQLVLGVVLLVAVTAFEIDMQFVTEWERRAEPSPYFDPAHKWTCPAGLSLLVHLGFAIPTALLWLWVIVGAWRGFPTPPRPTAAHSPAHRFWGVLAALGMVGTAVTGWVFYALAFAL